MTIGMELPWGCTATFYNGMKGGPTITTTLDAAVRSYLNTVIEDERARITVTAAQPIKIPAWSKPLTTFEVDELDQLGECMPIELR